MGRNVGAEKPRRIKRPQTCLLFNKLGKWHFFKAFDGDYDARLNCALGLFLQYTLSNLFLRNITKLCLSLSTAFCGMTWSKNEQVSGT